MRSDSTVTTNYTVHDTCRTLCLLMMWYRRSDILTYSGSVAGAGKVSGPTEFRGPYRGRRVKLLLVSSVFDHTF
jgi:hypothetical protein